MSIARELLKRVLIGDDDGDFFLSHGLYKEIQELLTQPEQIKRSALTEAEISKTLKLSRRSTEWDYGFEAGVGFAEEFHGIGL